MNTIDPAEFSEFFREVYGHDPFPWQAELARRACSNDWPKILALPTGSGKTASLDAAIFALAAQAHLSIEKRSAPRRIFFVVNRRVIVDEAFERGCKLARALLEPTSKQPTVQRVAEALRKLTGDPKAPPLDVFELRGGVYRDNRWARSLLQPTILTSTLDQFGSRLLFRGYGVSSAARPIHAALTAHDALVMLDEAHISRAFADTIKTVQRYREFYAANERSGLTGPRMPFVFVQMSATLAQADEILPEEILKLNDADRAHPILKKRLGVSKPVARLRIAEKAKGEDAPIKIADALVEEAEALETAGTIAIMVNRVATGRAVHSFLRQKYPNVRTELVIGRMRPLDRDKLTCELRAALATDAPPTAEAPRFVIATQCLEVGADLDFHALVTECASIDALRQRFGRVNRSGDRPVADSVIVIRADQVATEEKLAELEKQEKPLDPIYGNALSRSWLWLNELFERHELDFGLDRLDALIATLRSRDPGRWEKLFVPPTQAPILLPAYLDCWSQTSPAPQPDPDPALFLHGPQRGQAEIKICFRSDLPDERGQWVDTVSLLPPTAPELLAVPLATVRALFSKQALDNTSDLLETGEPEVEASGTLLDAVLWRGPRRSRIRPALNRLAPGDTLVVPTSDRVWSALKPPEKTEEVEEKIAVFDDIAERSFRQARAKDVVRLRRQFFPDAAATFAELIAWACDPNSDWNVAQIRSALRASADEMAGESSQASDLQKALRHLANEKHGLLFEPYPDGNGMVLRTRLRVPQLITSAALAPFDEGDDFLSRANQKQTIVEHTDDVRDELNRLIRNLPSDAWGEALFAAADFHDWGKADERFQALLLNSDRAMAWAQPKLWAKSERLPVNRAARDAARRRAEIPNGFRHEMLSLQLAQHQSIAGRLPTEEILRALALHLIAAHHGRARPFAPIVDDRDPPEIVGETLASNLILSTEERRHAPAHAVDSGIAERFWFLNRALGPWGLAWIESVLRLADQVASERAGREESSIQSVSQHELQPC